MPFLLCTQGILQLFLKYPSREYFFDLLQAATPRRGERHLVSFLPFLILTYWSGMQFTSEHFQMYHFQRGLHVTTHNRGLLHCLQSQHMSAKQRSYILRLTLPCFTYIYALVCRRGITVLE